MYFSITHPMFPPDSGNIPKIRMKKRRIRNSYTNMVMKRKKRRNPYIRRDIWPQGTRWLKWLECEFTDRKVRGSNPTSASRLPLSRLGQPGNISPRFSLGSHGS
ncbi:hypothetical protein CSKR_108055 [Clonorchis sinensis]|uniref:Uncharacterized protein n=1 Tax=Clonorchis sinensis TaxID=79923 RepID=A0A419PMY8_CLOSI|nr:hypothetical protein CSKR_108055 [Clonorchis sinensis]